MTQPHVANSHLFPRPPSLALATPLPMLRATLWRLGRWRHVVQCGDLVVEGEAPTGALCVLLDDAGQGAQGLRVVWWDMQPAETIPSIRQAAADVRSHAARHAAADPLTTRSQTWRRS